jgi:hypothetical protein
LEGSGFAVIELLFWNDATGNVEKRLKASEILADVSV